MTFVALATRLEIIYKTCNHASGRRGQLQRPAGDHKNRLVHVIDSPIALHLVGRCEDADIAFGLDDIDELMLGANLMENRGWKNSSMNSSGGVSRHRISSAIYYYCDMPGKAGEAEYHADTDYLDDNWVPRAWDFKFGSLLWSNNAPARCEAEPTPEEE